MKIGSSQKILRIHLHLHHRYLNDRRGDLGKAHAPLTIICWSRGAGLRCSHPTLSVSVSFLRASPIFVCESSDIDVSRSATSGSVQAYPTRLPAATSTIARVASRYLQQSRCRSYP